ncbi:GTA baseplate fiber-binding domain-containing protein, partial [Janibacter hoylei]|uniref:GTA baseplate fiber-binding domain-containing protein n=1 Tax=Janibacter hoylei TaxID=364298 RepID=UPI00248F80CA
ENRLLVGREVIQFLQAEQVGAYRWKLSGLLRGRAGTEEVAAIGHEGGTLAVLLNDRLTVLDPTLVPSAASTRIGAIGLGDSEIVFAELQNAGLS